MKNSSLLQDGCRASVMLAGASKVGVIHPGENFTHRHGSFLKRGAINKAAP